jgi:succinate dehydrogenase / fumarate reductase flavoprotein subunit
MARDGEATIRAKYGNLFDMYHHITDQDPYKLPMMIYPASHYTMGGLWVDYDLMSNIPGLFVLGEANFSDHGANRLGASALMQGLADGYFVAPYTIGNYLATGGFKKAGVDAKEFADAEAVVKDGIDKLLKPGAKGSKTVHEFQAELGHIMWEKVGMGRNEAGLKKAITEIGALREQYATDVKLTGSGEHFNKNLEDAGRVADFLELGELMARDALERRESCGGHFREESQTEEGEALRDDANFCHVAAWEYKGPGATPELHKEPLVYENVKLTQRSYK